MAKKKIAEVEIDLSASYEDLLGVFAETKTPEDVKALFEDMFTESERRDFTIRWKLMNDLYRHVSQRTIANELHISLCRITRGSRMLKKSDGYVRRLLEKRYDDHYQI